MFGYASNETADLMPAPALLRAQDPRIAREGPQGRRRRRDQARPRRQEPGDGEICRRQAGRRDADRAFDPACRRRPDVRRRSQDRRALYRRDLAQGLDFRRDRLARQSDRQIRDRRTRWRHRPHRPQDHCRHLRRRGAAWRRRLLRQGSDQGGSLRRLCRALSGQERRRGRACRSRDDPARPTRSAWPIRCRSMSTPTAPPRSTKRRWKTCCSRSSGCRRAAFASTSSLNRPIYARTSAYGHFGREPDADGGFSWEKTDLVDKLKTHFA